MLQVAEVVAPISDRCFYIFRHIMLLQQPGGIESGDLSLASSGCGRGRRLSWRRASAHGEYVSMATGCDRGCGGWSGECRHRARGLTAECTTWGIAVMVFAFASCSIRAMSPGHTLRKARVMQHGALDTDNPLRFQMAITYLGERAASGRPRLVKSQSLGLSGPSE
jgi:hypothetical protein